MKKFAVLTMALLCVVALVLCACGEEVPTYSFVAPTKVSYEVGEALDLSGAKVIVDYQKQQDEEVALTMQMLDSATLPDMIQSGAYTVKGSYQGYQFSFGITVNPETPATFFVAPTKLVYFVGETLSLDGAKVVYQYNHSQDQEVALTMDMLTASTLPNMSVAGTYVVNGTYQDFNFSFTVTVSALQATGVELQLAQANANYVRTTNFDGYVNARVNFNNGTSTEWLPITASNVASYQFGANAVTLNVEVSYQSTVYTASIDIPFAEETVSVDQLLSGQVGNTYLLKGVIAAFATTVKYPEVVIVDQATGKFVTVAKLGEGDLHSGEYNTCGFSIGDEIVVPVTLTQHATDSESSNSQKLYGMYAGGKMYQTAVISSGNKPTYDFTQADVIDSQADLQAFLSNSNRVGNLYKKVVLKGEMCFILYPSANCFRFWFADTQINALSQQYVEGVSPVISSASAWYTTGKNFGELAFDNAHYSPSDWDNPGTGVLSVEALYIGGNGYYHQFVLLDENCVQQLEVNVVGSTFTAPTVTTYALGTKLNLTGASITIKYDLCRDKVVPITMDMLDPTTLPDFTTPGTYTVKGTCEGQQFSFDVVVSDVSIKSIAVKQAPTNTIYGHRQGLADIDLTGGVLAVTYTSGDTVDIDMTREMLPLQESPNWQIGEVYYTLTYFGCTTELKVTYQNQALTIAQFLQLNDGEKADVTGVVVGPVSAHATTELILKDKNSMDILSVYVANDYKQVVGSYNAIALNDKYYTAGDEIIIEVTRDDYSVSSNPHGGANKKRALAGGISAVDESIKLSTGNAIVWDWESAKLTTISTQAQLVDFINNRNSNYYTFVKFVNVKGVYANSGYRIFFDSVTSLDTQKIGGLSPFIYHVNANYYLTKDVKSYFTNSESKDYANPATTSYSIYALFVGGSTSYYDFAVMSDSWIVSGV